MFNFLKIIIVNFGGIVFSVQPIEWDHWMWSLFLGVGTLLWQQVVLLVPDSVIENLVQKVCCCCYKSDEKEQNEEIELKKPNTNGTTVEKKRIKSNL